MANGKTINAKVMEFILIKKVRVTKDTGTMTPSMEMAQKYGLKDPNTVAITNKVRSKDMELTIGQMGLFMRVIGTIIKSMDKAITNGKMAENTGVSGR